MTLADIFGKVNRKFINNFYSKHKIFHAFT